MAKQIVIYHCGDKNAPDCNGNCKECKHLGSVEILGTPNAAADQRKDKTDGT